jgi:mono/diheme cytochrome c family protein
MRRTNLALIALLVFASAVACKRSQPRTVYMPDMAYSPALKAQEEGSNFPVVRGTVSRDFQKYEYLNDPDAAGRELKNPVQQTAANFKRGQVMYNTYCIVCHGAGGDGDGTIVPKFPRPPSLHSDKVRGWSDGRIYHVITVGQNLMPSYATQISQQDRWALIHYVRALQRAKKPTPEDLKAFEQANK